MGMDSLEVTVYEEQYPNLLTTILARIFRSSRNRSWRQLESPIPSKPVLGVWLIGAMGSCWDALITELSHLI